MFYSKYYFARINNRVNSLYWKSKRYSVYKSTFQCMQIHYVSRKNISPIIKQSKILDKIRSVRWGIMYSKHDRVNSNSIHKYSDIGMLLRHKEGAGHVFKWAATPGKHPIMWLMIMIMNTMMIGICIKGVPITWIDFHCETILSV